MASSDCSDLHGVVGRNLESDERLARSDLVDAPAQVSLVTALLGRASLVDNVGLPVCLAHVDPDVVRRVRAVLLIAVDVHDDAPVKLEVIVDPLIFVRAVHCGRVQVHVVVGPGVEARVQLRLVGQLRECAVSLCWSIDYLGLGRVEHGEGIALEAAVVGERERARSPCDEAPVPCEPLRRVVEGALDLDRLARLDAAMERLLVHLAVDAGHLHAVDLDLVNARVFLAARPRH